ncbi:MAG: tRNA pseudouridine(55) synthase TruB [Candidatus Magasanikbacteria bacterium]|jgi:tRNA pseudouridine55 synthase|nr:tRNA pseudouridine(55) synthase TruB [Candidatus Magasanikbacteria bacterium]
MIQEAPSGFLLIDKPTDWTSHDVVGYLRGVTGIRKIGHAGTLDPFATGLLIVAVSRAATKRIDEFQGMTKIYETTLQFGSSSDTQDLTGVLSEVAPLDDITLDESVVLKTLLAFTGTIQQIPPMYSAKKVGGKKLYELAREGKEIERQPVEINIDTLELLGIDTEKKMLSLRVVCSKGTYIRTLCHDIGAALGFGGYCATLRRTHIGEFSVEQAVEPKSLEKTSWQKRLLAL